MALYVVRLPKRRSRVFGEASDSDEYKRGDKVVVESEFGPMVGMVIDRWERGNDGRFPTMKILGRFEGEKDRESEEEALLFCQRKALERGIPMRFVRCEKVLDGSKIIFYFVAPSRVDFRELLRDLARRFRRRIELRQIGIRDAIKMMGGIGPCGYEVCCSRFIDNFESISIKMAKDQNLILNPDKISGLCGKLLCCLMYEKDIYEEERKDFPPVGTEVFFYGSKGVVVGHNILSRSVIVDNGDGHRFLVKLEDIEKERRESA